MRISALLGTLFLALNAGAQTSPNDTWAQLKDKRERLPGVHQEFDISQTFKTASSTQAMKRQVVLDMSPGHWRENSISGSGSRIRIFDGKDLFLTEAGDDEFERIKRRPKDQAPLPFPYSTVDADWSKAEEAGQRPCGLSGNDHSCVVLRAPLKKWTRANSGSSVTRMTDGSAAMILDTETGLLISLRTVELIEGPRGAYRSEITSVLKRVTWDAPVEASLFAPPADAREVKELSKWNAEKIKKQLAGKPAPELAATDIQGNPVALSALRGKTVLLDFWTTWCPPCRADAPSLDKLYRKYGGQDLAIVGVSVSEDRAIVEKFLKEHPHGFPIMLTSENEMPRPYQIGAFPTYIVIGPDGVVTAAVEGDQGFSELRKLLRKAGMEVD